MTGQERPTYEEKTVKDYSPNAGVVEDEVMVRVQGGVCNECNQPLIRYAEPDTGWEEWLKERGGP